MIAISALLASLLGLMLSIKVGLLIWGIKRNQKEGRALRESLAARLAGLPLRRMLQSRHVPERAYLNDQRIVDIEQQLRICASCEETPRCRALLNSAADWTFCPLEDVMSRLPAEPV